MDNRKRIDPFSQKIKSTRYKRMKIQKSLLAHKKDINYPSYKRGYDYANTVFLETSPGVFSEVSTKRTYIKRVCKGHKSAFLKKMCNKKVRKSGEILLGKNNDYRRFSELYYYYV